MRIFFAVPRSAWVDANLRRSLEAMGHELVRFSFPGWPDDADPDWQRKGKPETNERLLRAVQRAHAERPLDLVYGYLYSSVAYPETLDEVRRTGVPTVNFSCNNVHQFELVAPLANHVDLNVVPERSALPKFAAIGAPTARIQLAANPMLYRPLPEPRLFDVTFVGQRYADRADFLVHLQRAGIAVRAWGAGWQTRKRWDLATLRAAWSLVEDERLDGVRRLVEQRTRRNGHAAPSDPVDDGLEGEIARFGGPRLTQHDLVRTFSRSRISLGFATAGESHRGPRRLTHLRLREFEAPMSGALFLAEQQDELAEYFTIGQEVLTYTDREDLLDTVRYYLAHPEQAERVRSAGRQRAVREHTWAHRFRQLFDVLGLRG